LPVRLRGNLKGNRLVVTKGGTQAIFVFTPDDWEEFCQNLSSAAESFDETMLIQHQFFIPAAEQEIDKAGRIAIPPSLREYAGLNRDCEILEARKHLEIWDSEIYKAYLRANQEKLQGFMEKARDVAIFR
jgi:MraZ protein